MAKKTERTAQDYVGMIKTKLMQYYIEREKFEKKIADYEASKDTYTYISALNMVKGNKGMLDFVIRDLEAMIKDA